jgi:signal transduction histidine kinase
VTLSLQHGNCGMTAPGCVSFSLVLWVLGHYDAGYRFAQLGVDLNRRLRAEATEPFVDFLFAAFSAPWQRPLDGAIKSLRRTIERGVECGDVAHSGYAAMFLVAYRQIKGDPLREVLDDARRLRKLAIRLGLPEIEAWLRLFPRHLRTWTDEAPTDGDGELDVEEMERDVVAAGGSVTVLAMVRSLTLEQRYWQGDHAGAREYGRLVASGLAAMPGSLYNAEARFYYCLASIALDGAQLQPEAEALRGDLARYAASCPENYRHMSSLVEAELARSRGDVAQAMHHYDLAIESAAEHGFLKVEALANELAGQFWIGRDRPAFAAVHYTRARDLYEHWGARVKVRELEVKRRSLGTDDRHTVRTTSVASRTLDFETIAKASNAIASEIVLDNLLLKIMDMVVENTGAQAGSIVLESNGELLVQASKEHDGVVTVSGGVPLASARGISEGIVKYTMRTTECVVLAEATRHPIFRSDLYVRERRPRSVLCVPITRADRLVGAIYLENNLIADAFTIDRLDALGILVAQLAISIENAAMFARLASYRDHLEELVAERTSELTAANQQLREQSLVRQRMESELRLAQKLQSVGQLAAGVAHEINTPIQFVGNGLEFLSDAFDSMLALISTYRAAQVDPSDEIRAAEEEADIDYVVSAAPQVFVSARDGVKRVARIVSAMKAFSHPDQQGQAPSDLNGAIENTLAIAISEYRAVADVALELAPIPEVVCHLGEINQVVLNLIVNAAHAIGDAVTGTEGRGTISIATRLDLDDTVVISVSDTGCGIPAAIRERVFDPFFTTKEVGRGSGQGLALARTAIVDRHGGAIDFEARPGGGTTFHVRLPVKGKAHSTATPLAAAR